MKILRKNFLLLFFIVTILIFYYPTIFKFYLPIPTDTIVGLYHPFRDLYSKDYPNGVPFKNFLITDPVRQTYIWKELSISVLKKGELPLWNPYEMSGKPMLANFQAGVFYPFNIILFLNPYYFSWTIFIMSQTLLGGYFLYLYLKNQNIDPKAVLFGCIAFIFSGFITAWLEWGTIVSTALWLPLVLFSIDKMFETSLKDKNIWYFIVLLLLSLLFSFFAGHLQTFFYIALISFLYILLQIFSIKKITIKRMGLIVIVSLLFLVISSAQWITTFKYVNLSNRLFDQNYLLVDGWFMPFKHLIQFFAPDFFGNPATLNYWGTWNYGELVGYIGIIPLTFALLAILSRINRKSVFFSLILLFSLIFSLPTFLAKLPYLYQLPFISTSQPTRLLFLSCFSLSVLSSFGFDYFLKKNSRLLYAAIALMGMFFGLLWVVVFTANMTFFHSLDNLVTAKRNLILPTGIFVISIILIILSADRKKKYLQSLIIFSLILLTSIDLLRFSSKFNTFSKREYLYPPTRITSFLKNQSEIFRIASVDDRILPPNFATYYRLQSIEGYDPLYLKTYAQFITVMERNRADISEPLGFNRIITPQNFTSQLFDLLNVKYVLSIEEIKSDKLKFLFSEGTTKVYENTQNIPRTFFVDRIIFSKDAEDSMKQLYEYDLRKTAIVSKEDSAKLDKNEFNIGTAKILSYTENKIVILTENDGDGFLVLSDSFYPTWHAKIDDKEVEIIKTNYTFRGLQIPKGRHKIEFYITLF